MFKMEPVARLSLSPSIMRSRSPSPRGCFRVQFKEDSDVQTSHNDITVRWLDPSRLSVSLGFLKLYHRYHVMFTVPSCANNTASAATNGSTSWYQEKPNSFVKLVHFTLLKIGNADDANTNNTPNECSRQAEVELVAHKPGLQTEEVCVSRGDGDIVTIVFHAKVLGEGKGTPSLKTGIRCIGMEDQLRTEPEGSSDEESPLGTKKKSL